MDIDEILLKNGYDLSERPDYNLFIVCPDCAEFYTEHTAPASELVMVKENVRVKYFCNCHGNRAEMADAHEIGCNTPAMEWDKEKLELIHGALNRKADEIEKELENYA